MNTEEKLATLEKRVSELTQRITYLEKSKADAVVMETQYYMPLEKRVVKLEEAVNKHEGWFKINR